MELLYGNKSAQNLLSSIFWNYRSLLQINVNTRKKNALQGKNDQRCKLFKGVNRLDLCSYWLLLSINKSLANVFCSSITV